MKYILNNLLCLIVLMTWFMVIPVLAQEKPSLHTLFEESTPKTRAIASASDDVIVIDLSEWQNEYDATLNIATGKNYKFINGKLRWAGKNAPLIVVSNHSKISFEKDVTVNGNTISDSEIDDLSALIVIKDAYVIVHGATFHANERKSSNWERSYYKVFDIFCLENVENSMVKSSLSLYGGSLYGSITCESPDGNIDINNETLIQGGVRTNGTLLLEAQPIYYRKVLFPSNLKIDYKYEGQIDLANQGYLLLHCNLHHTKFTSSSSPTLVPEGYEYITNITVDESSYVNTSRRIARGDVWMYITDHSVFSYTIITSDLEAINIKNLDSQKYELVLINNEIVIQKKSIAGQQWLQEQIDSYVNISADTDAQPGVISIPEEGIELTGMLHVPSGAFVKLIGGPITFSRNFSQSPDHAVMIEDNALLYIDNKWDFNNVYSKPWFHKFVNWGHLTFGEKSTLINTWTERETEVSFITNRGTLDYNSPSKDVRISGRFVNGDGSVVIRDGGLWTQDIAITAKTCSLYGGTVQSPNIVVESDYFYMYGGVIISGKLDGGINVNHASLVNGSFHTTTSYVNTITSSGNISEHTIVFKDEINNHAHCLYLTSKLYGKQHIKADWNNIDFSSPYVIVRGVDDHYLLTDEDLKGFVFDDLPSNVKARLVGNTIELTSKKGNLHDLFADLPEDGGTEENPVDIMGDDDDVDMERPEDLKPDLHVLFGDPDDTSESVPAKKMLSVLFDGEYGMSIPSSSSVEFKNINVDLGEHSLNSFVEVHGTLIINVNVYLRNVCTCTHHVIHVRRGGTLIWRGGVNRIPGVVVYNDGGTIIYENGETYSTYRGIHNASGGKVYVKGGYISGDECAIYNESGCKTYIYEEGRIHGDIFSDGYLRTSGNIDVTNIYIPCNTYIDLTSRIVGEWFIHISNFHASNTPTAFICGRDGYVITEEDLQHIKTDLPDGYFLILDVYYNIIYIVDSCSSGVNDIKNTDDAVERLYSIDGNLSTHKKGLKILYMPNGTTRKVYLK